MRKVRIKRLPNKSQGGESGSSAGLARFMQGKKQKGGGVNPFSEPDFEVNKTISDVPEEEATMEVEHNEQIVAPGMGGIPEMYRATGKRHANGGINVNLAEGAFVFSDHKTGKKGKRGMKIKDKEILAQFGMSVPKKGRNKGYTPAQIAKKFELNDYKGMLLDPNSDRFERETAELMIANNNLKLAQLGLVQESMKGFPQGIPEISMPYLEHLQMNPEEFLPQEQAPQGQPMMAQYGAGVIGDPSQYSYQNGGENNRMAKRFPGLDVAQRGGVYEGAFWQSIMQDGGQNAQENLYSYLEEYGATGDTLTYGNKDIVNTDKKYKDFKYEPQMKSGNRVVLDNQPFKADSVVTNQGFPEDTGVAWINGKPVVVPTAKGATGAMDFQNKFGNYKSSGSKYRPTVTPGYKRRENMEEISTRKFGGAIEYAQRGKEERRIERELNREARRLKSFTDPVSKPGSIPLDSYNETMTFEEFTDNFNKKRKEKAEKQKEIRKQARVENAFRVNAYSRNNQPEEVKTSTKSTSTYNVPSKYKDSKKYEEGSSEYVAADIKEGDYVKRGDKWFKATGKQSILPEYKGKDIDKVFAGNKDIAAKYAYLEKTFTDPDVKKAFADKTREALKDEKYYKSKHGKTSKAYAQFNDPTHKDYVDIDKMTDDELVNHHLKMQKRNYGLVANDINPKHFDQSGKVRPEYAELYEGMDNGKDITSIKGASEHIGVGFGDQGLDNTLGFEQASYIGYNNLLSDRDNLDAGLQEKISHLKQPAQIGADDEQMAGISSIDRYYTDTSAGELDILDDLDEMQYEEADIEEIPGSPELEEVRADAPAEFWLQDKINMRNLAMQRLQAKKYNPNLQTVDLANPDVLYYDPSRALAANVENQIIQNELIKSQGSSAAAAAQASGVAGQSMANAANILSDYEGRNIQVGNQYLDRVKQTADMESVARGQALDKFWDQSTIANQQYDNTLRAMDRNLAVGEIQAWDNAWDAQVFNQQHDQYNTRPGIGGGMHYTGVERPFENTGAPNNDGYLAEFSKLASQYPGASESAIENHLNNKYGMNNQPRRRNRAQKAFNQGYTQINAAHPNDYYNT